MAEMSTMQKLHVLSYTLLVYCILVLAILQYAQVDHVDLVDDSTRHESSRHESSRYESPSPANSHTQRKEGAIKGEIVDPAHEPELIIHNRSSCNVGTRTKKLLILVSSKPESSNIRRTIRETWGSWRESGGFSIVVMFMLGIDDMSMHFKQKLVLEQAVTQDLIVGRFEDGYQNMTRKTLMGLHWALDSCPSATHIMKADEDVFIVIPNVIPILKSLAPSTIFGYCTHGPTQVSRNPVDPHYVSYLIWKEPTVPPYCFGLAYGMDAIAASLIVRSTSRLPLFPLEDVFLGIAVQKSEAPILIYDLGTNYSLHADQTAFGMTFCKLRNTLAFHQVGVTDLRQMFTSFTGYWKNGTDDCPDLTNFR